MGFSRVNIIYFPSKAPSTLHRTGMCYDRASTRIVIKRSRRGTLSTGTPTTSKLQGFLWTDTAPTVWVAESGKYKAAA